MAFWTDKNTKEPLRQNRWYLRFGDPEETKDKNGKPLLGYLDSFNFALKECKKPEYEIGVTEHRLLTHTLRYPTLLKWKPIDIKYVAARGDKETDLAFVLNAKIQNSGYSDPTNNVHQQINKSNFKYLGGSFIELIQIDANGNEIEIWKIYNPFISNINYGTLSYENDGFVDITCTIQYDWAEYDTSEKIINNKKSDESKKVNPGFSGK